MAHRDSLNQVRFNWFSFSPTADNNREIQNPSWCISFRICLLVLVTPCTESFIFTTTAQPHRNVATMTTMSSSRAVTAALRRNSPRQLPARAFSHLPQRSTPSRCTSTRPRTILPQALGSRRAFSISTPRRFADVSEEAFDPRSIERESDQVDVCIVGGGILPFP